jgi:hypothetical protein
VTQQDEKDLLQFFEVCSQRSLEDFFLSKANQADLCRKELNEVIGRMVENAALIWLGDFLRRYRQRLLEQPHEAPQPAPPKPVHLGPRVLDSAAEAARKSGTAED